MRIQFIIFLTWAYMNTYTVFSQDSLNICIKRIQLSDVDLSQEGQEEQLNCFDYISSCLNFRDSLT